MKGIRLQLFVLLIALALAHAGEPGDGSSGVRHARHATVATPEEIGPCAQASCAPAVDDDEVCDKHATCKDVSATDPVRAPAMLQVMLSARALPASKETIARSVPTIGQPAMDSARQPHSSFAAIQHMKGRRVTLIVMTFVGVLACGALFWRFWPHVRKCSGRSWHTNLAVLKGGYEIHEDDESRSWDVNEAWLRTGHHHRQPAAATTRSPQSAQQLPSASERGRQELFDSARYHDPSHSGMHRFKNDPTYVPGVGKRTNQQVKHVVRRPHDDDPEGSICSSSSAPAASSRSLPPRSSSEFFTDFVDPLDEMATKVNAAGTKVLGLGQRAAYGVGNMGGKVLKTVDRAAKPLTKELKDQKAQLEYRWQKAREGNVG